MESGEAIRRTRPAEARFVDWRAPDGWICRRMDWLQPAGRAARGSLLFAGGRGDFIEKYLEAYAWWHRSGWNVTAFDWRSQGRSQGDQPGGRLLSFDPLIEDLAALIADWRRETHGPHVAIGHSMGGHMLLRTLVEKRPQLDAAVLVAPMIRVNSAPLPEALAPWIARFMCLVGRRDLPVWKVPPPDGSQADWRRQRFLTSSRERYEDELWWWQQEPGFNLGGVTWGWLRAAYRSAAAFVPEKLAKVDLPVLLLAAERDRLVSTEAIRRVAALLPNGELEVYADAGHEILREGDPTRLAALDRIDAFLDQHGPASP